MLESGYGWLDSLQRDGESFEDWTIRLAQKAHEKKEKLDAEKVNEQNRYEKWLAAESVKRIEREARREEKNTERQAEQAKLPKLNGIDDAIQFFGSLDKVIEVLDNEYQKYLHEYDNKYYVEYD